MAATGPTPPPWAAWRAIRTEICASPSRTIRRWISCGDTDLAGMVQASSMTASAVALSPWLGLRRSSNPAHSCGWRIRKLRSADPWQGVADQEVDDPGPPERRLQQHQAGRVVPDPADHGRALAQGMGAERAQGGLDLVAVVDRKSTR